MCIPFVIGNTIGQDFKLSLMRVLDYILTKRILSLERWVLLVTKSRFLSILSLRQLVIEKETRYGYCDASPAISHNRNRKTTVAMSAL
jgi:hypothetical protein